MTTYTPELGERIIALLTEFKLSSAAEQMIKRFVDAGCDQALVTLAEVLEVEAQTRRERRVDRLRRASRLPPAKTFDTLDATRVPRNVLIQVRELARGHFVDRADNVLLFGRPGVGKSHLACAIGHALVDAGISVLFTPTYQLVQQLLVARRDLSLPRALRTLDAYDVMICDDLARIIHACARPLDEAAAAGRWGVKAGSRSR
jgi:DNA replication protein DnaC